MLNFSLQYVLLALQLRNKWEILISFDGRLDLCFRIIIMTQTKAVATIEEHLL